MTKTTQRNRQTWQTPRLKRLGTMRDIAGPRGGTSRNGSNTDRRS